MEASGPRRLKLQITIRHFRHLPIPLVVFLRVLCVFAVLFHACLASTRHLRSGFYLFGSTRVFTALFPWLIDRNRFGRSSRRHSPSMKRDAGTTFSSIKLKASRMARGVW